jgi:transcription elongation factor GreA
VTSTQMTQEAHDRLTVELAEFDCVTLPALAEEVISARTDSLSPIESQALMTAVMELHQTESRASRLRDLLASAEIVETTTGVRAGVGSQVTLTEPDGDSFQVLLGSQHERSSDSEVATTSPQSPLGAAVLGAGAGDTVTWQTPGGDTFTAVVTGLR